MGKWDISQDLIPQKKEKPVGKYDISGEIAPTAPPEDKFSVGKMARNIPRSAVQYGKDIFSAVAHPIETVKGVGRLVAGGAQKVIPGEQEQEKYFDAAKNFYSEKYSKGFLKALEADPVGVAGDVSTLLTGAGGGLSAAGKIGKIGALQKTGKVVSTAGKLTEPVNAATKVTGLQLATKAGARKLYASAVKLPKGMDAAERTAQIATGLENYVFPTDTGLRRLQKKISKIGNEIRSIIDSSAKRGDVVVTKDVVSRLDGLRKFYDATVGGESSVAAIDDLIKEFSAKEGAVIPIKRAQELKQNTGAVLRKAYGEMTTAIKDAKKQIVRGLKEEIVAKNPALAKLNPKQGAMIGLEESINNAIGRIEKRDLVGIGIPISSSAASAAGGPQAGINAAIAKVLIDAPRVKTALAIALNEAKKQTKRTGFHRTAFQAGRLTRASVIDKE